MATPLFAPSTYTRRRAALVDAITERTAEAPLLVLPGHDESPMNYAGNVYPFWQEPSFLYYFGLHRPSLAGTIDLEDGTATLYGDTLTTDDLVWTGPMPRLEEQAAHIGASLRPRSDFAEVVGEALEADRPVWILPPSRPAVRLTLADVLRASPDGVEAYISETFIRTVVAQRSVKEPEEVAEIEAALAVSYALHTEAMRETRPGRTEQALAGHLEGFVQSHGRRLAFPMIFTQHGEVLHNHPTSAVLEPGRLALCDAGATSPRHYASDITRTFPVSGRFSRMQRALYELVLGVQQHAVASVRPGVLYGDLHLQASKGLAVGLRDLGVLQGDLDEAVAAGAHALFFPHGLGHMMGIDVHDMEGLGEDYVGYGEDITRSDQFGLRSLRLARTLEPGFVVTVEPGLYFIPDLIRLWQSEGKHTDFIDYEAALAFAEVGGIRIEDDVLVTDDAYRLLGPPIPKTVDAIEAVMAGA